ncbi:MAG: lycopene cyclase domain-containing protein [Bacteroidales bacterium]|nr:lycopene cyclase domain-containing protein [Bacteroidales bacterium]
MLLFGNYYVNLYFPFLLSFDKKVAFNKKWPQAFAAIFITSLLYITWDILFVDNGIWGFNSMYITGLHFFNLPLEEILFFVAVPFASLFTFEVFNTYLTKLYLLNRYMVLLTRAIFVALIVLAMVSYNLMYSFTATLFASIVLLLLYVFARKWLACFMLTFAVLFIGFMLVNGALTGGFTKQPVVWYNPNHIWGIRLATIPLEDIIYSLSLFGSNVLLYTRFNQKPV